MTENQITEKIKTAYQHAVPHGALDSILADCDNEKGSVIQMTNSTPTRSHTKKWIAVAATLIVVFGSVIGFAAYQFSHTAASIVCLDVNPSIEIELDKNDRALKVNALNEDAKIIVGDMDFTGSDIEVVVNALIGSMLKEGYLSDTSNSLLLSVEGKSADRTTRLQQELNEIIDYLMTSSQFEGSVISQTITGDDSTYQSLASQYNISIGKAKLIQEIVTNNSTYKFEDLAGLSINELNLLSSRSEQSFTDISTTGSASDKGYIGTEKALSIALQHAGFTASNILGSEVEMDYENGTMAYEVKFVANGIEYEYDINANTGEILKYDTERDDGDYDYDDTPSAATTSITHEEAKTIALKKAGVSNSDISQYEAELDTERGKPVYEISFEAGKYEYEMEVDANSGDVYNYEREYRD